MKLIVFLFILIAMGYGDICLASPLSFMPDNDLHLEDDLYLYGGVDRDSYDIIMEEAHEIYSPIFTALGKNLIVEDGWNISEVNAYAQCEGRNCYIKIFGGLARRYEITEEGLTMVVCHELGHIMGGFPFVQYPFANEGQADYYASQVCAKRFWWEKNNALYRDQIGGKERLACDRAYKYAYGRELCYRSMAGAWSTSSLLATMDSARISFSTPDSTVVGTTYNSHPNAQCRLDTYFKASLCPVGRNDRVIPTSETDAYKYSCSRYHGFTEGNRPLCWYRPTMWGK